ncbi:MAG: hypothetical protein HY652_08535 [Acidobacteria bacterium]|nr:hypothetical protein [Acidobacteriota bacterium]
MDERQFYHEQDTSKPARLNCPHCRQVNEYQLRWLVRTKKDRLPPGANERDREAFAKARSYMVRRDEVVHCTNPRCRKRFEVSGIQSVHIL